MDEFVTNSTIPVQKMIIELNERTSLDLAHRQQQEKLNASTLFNRAMQVYHRIMTAQETGERIIIGNKEFTIT
jgi:hypothetical protein